MTTQDDYIDSVLGNLPRATPQREQIALELRGHIAERLAYGHPLDQVLRQLGDPLKLAESYLQALPLVPAPLWGRVRAKLVDALSVTVVMLMLAAVPAALVFWQAASFDRHWLLPLVPLVVIVGGSFVFAGYTVLAEHLYGQTLGKHLMGLRVVRESGARISLGQSVVRQLAMFLQVIWIDALFALFTDKRQRAFEMLSRTRTVQDVPGAVKTRKPLPPAR
jgi:uncharacterized RDD family membrane protein YckC